MITWFGNETSVPPAYWVPEPNGRGTSSILISCLTTLALCLWSALHLNIPAHGRPTDQIILKISWLFVGLLAPEIIIITAICQRRMAHKFTLVMREAMNQSVHPMPRRNWKTKLHKLRGLSIKSTGRACSDKLKKAWQSCKYLARVIRQPYDTNDEREKYFENEEEVELSSSQALGGSPVVVEAGDMQHLNAVEQEDVERYGISSGISTYRDKTHVQIHKTTAISAENGSLGQEPPKTQTVLQPLSKRVEWTNVHSFFALMGGFAFDTSMAKHKFLPHGRRRLTITPRGLLLIMEIDPELLPDITEQEIKDKSKADRFVKALVCLQALWFCVQCITRISQGMVISLLELNVFAHAVCALSVYMIWWDKPLDISEPALIRSEKSHEMCAFMCMTSENNQGHFISALKEVASYIVASEFPSCMRFGQNRWSGWRCLLEFSRLFHRIFRTARAERLQHIDYINWRPSMVNITDMPNCEGVTLANGDIFAGFQYEPEFLSKNYTSVDPDPVRRIRLFSTDCWRWQLSSKVFIRYDIKNNNAYQNGVTDRMPNWPRLGLFPKDSDDRRRRIELPRIAILAPTIYGALHVLAWDAPFKGSAEQLLWHLAGSTITASILFIGMWSSLGWVFDCLRNLHYILESVGSWTLILVFYLLCILYVFCRFYLVIESCVQVAYLPSSAYQTPNWSLYFPHIG